MIKIEDKVDCAKQYIREHYHNATLSEEIVSTFVGLTAISFSNLFKQTTGQTYISYLREVRMKEAERLLYMTNEKTCVIAKKVGIEDANYFSYLFKKQYGTSPSQYRKKTKDEVWCKREKEREVFIKQTKYYIQNHYQNARLSQERISETFHISRIYFSSLFRKVTGQTYVSYLKEVRMQAAAELLVETQEKACVIAEKVGFEDSNYFSFAFKKYFGMSPSKYRENEKNEELAC